MFEQLMKGLDEVEAYLEGEREGFRVTAPELLEDAAADDIMKRCTASASPLPSAE